MTKLLIWIIIFILIYFIIDLRKQVKQLKEYYKDLKLDNEIAKAKRIQSSRQVENPNNCV